MHGDTHRRAALLEVLCLRSNKTQNTTRDISTVPEGARCHNSTVCSTAPRTNSPIAQRSAIAQSDALQRCPPPAPWPLPPVAPLPSAARPGAGTAPTRLPPTPPLPYRTKHARPGPAQLSSRSALPQPLPAGSPWEAAGGVGGVRVGGGERSPGPRCLFLSRPSRRGGGVESHGNPVLRG